MEVIINYCHLIAKNRIIAEVYAQEKPLTFKDIYDFMSRVSNVEQIYVNFSHEKSTHGMKLKKDFTSFVDFHFKFYLQMAKLGI